MKTHILSLASLLVRLSRSVNADDVPCVETIDRDVVIIGGGSAGTYTAIELQRQNRSVALIEKLPQLGGNVNTYVDPINNQTFDNGVVVFEDIAAVNDYFEYLNIPTTKHAAAASVQSLYVNFATGATVSAEKLAAGNVTAAVEAYATQLHRYPYLTNGFNLPPTIPPDFFLPWGEFIQKYHLQGMAFTVSGYNQGIGNILDQPTLYMFKYLNQGEVDELLTGVFVRTAANNNQLIYDTALAKLGSDVFLRSNVLSVRRSTHDVQVAIDTPHGKKLIRARQLVVAIRPTLAALEPFFDLRPNERALFAQWRSSYYWCGLVSNSGLPSNVSATNADPAAPFGIPPSPGLYSVDATGLPSGLHSVYYSSPYPRSDAAVQAAILADLARVRRGQGYPAPAAAPEFVYWHGHIPFFLTVPPAAIRAGFYTKLEALQGRTATHWTGAAWQSEDSSVIWNFTRTRIVPSVLHQLAQIEAESGNGV